MHEVKITAVLNGWKCKVGRQEVVFNDVDKLCGVLRDYLVSPDETIKRYQTDSVNAKWADPRPAAEIGQQTEAGYGAMVDRIQEVPPPPDRIR